MSNDLISIRSLPENQEVIQKLGQLEEGMKDKALYTAVRAGATVVSNLMKATSPDDPTTPGTSLALAVNVSRLKAGQAIRVEQGRQTRASVEPGDVSAVAGPNKSRATIGGGKYNLRMLQNIALWLEHGTRPHKIGKRQVRLRIGRSLVTGPIQHPGARPQRWMQRSLESAGPQIIAEFYRSLENFLED